MPVGRWILPLASALALTSTPPPAAATGRPVHSPTRPAPLQGAVSGRVTSAGSGRPVAGATVQVQGTRLGALSGEDGRYVITGVPAGRRELRVTALGYRTLTETVDVPEGGSATADFGLALQPVQVGGVEVSVLRPDLQPQGELTERQVKRANPKDSGELLRNVTGVDAVRRGPLGMDPVVRGLRETEIGTYVDGSRWFTAGPARMDSPLTHLDPSAIQSIQVVKGPYALTWGAGNQSAIRVETRSLPPRGVTAPSGSLNVGYDSNLRARETYGNVGARAGALSFWAQGAWRDGDDYESGSGVTVPGDFRSWEGRGKVGYDVGANTLLSFSAGYQRQDSIDYPGRLLNATYFHSRNLSARLESRPDGARLRTFDVEVYDNHVDHAMGNWEKPTAMPMEGRTPPFALDVDVAASADVWGGRTWADLAAGPWSVRVGGDVYSLNRDAVRTIKRKDTGMTMFTDLMWPDATITDGGVYTRVQRGGSGARFTGTVRLDRVDAGADTASDFFLQNVATALDATETNVSAAATVGLPLGAGWDLSLGLGSAVRTADATERYSDRVPASKAQTSAEFVGNPALAPERSTQGDVWLEGRVADAQLRFDVFGRKVANYITLTPTDLPKRLPLSPSTVYRYVNGDATFWGAEASATVGLTPTLTADVSGSYLWGRDDALDEPALGVQPLNGDATLRYQEPGGVWFLEGTLHAVGRQGRVATTRGEEATPGYATTDLRAGWAPLPGVSLRFGVQNVFDRSYVEHLNARNPFSGARIPEPGRVVFLDATYGF